MKKNIYSIVLLLVVSFSFSQVKTYGAPIGTLSSDDNMFLDAATYNNIPGSGLKGLSFPKTDLTTFVFKTSVLPNGRYDGYVVYNTKTVLSTDPNYKVLPSNNQLVELKEGFYYFSNPLNKSDLKQGIWKPVGSAASENLIDVTENTTNKRYMTNDVFSLVVPFSVPAGNASAEFTLPTNTAIAGIKDVYSFKVVKLDAANGVAKTVVANDVANFDPTTRKFTNGSGIIYQVLEAGEYRAIIEYTK